MKLVAIAGFCAGLAIGFAIFIPRNATVAASQNLEPLALRAKVASAANCPTPASPEPDFSLAHITRGSGLPRDYIPPDLIDISSMVRTQGAVCVTQKTAQALARMFGDAEKDGIYLMVFSGYRSPGLQAHILEERRAVDLRADFAVAPPSFSEHQTGTAVDITGASVEYREAQNGFEYTQEYAWLAAHAWEYGFNLSYPPSLKNSSPREFRYEPWHWRYVGVEISVRLHNLGISYNGLPAPTATIAVQ